MRSLLITIVTTALGFVLLAGAPASGLAVQDTQFGGVSLYNGLDDPDFSVGRGPDAMSVKVVLTSVNSESKAVLVDWGDGTQTTISAARVGDVRTHPYTDLGVYIIQVAYADGSTDGSAKVVVLPIHQ